MDEIRWWSLRASRSNRPETYTCPLCGRRLHAMSDHVVIAPEGDVERRRHAHLECVAAARNRGSFRTEDDWRATQPRRPGLLSRLFGHE
ncbi:MAG TPA: hypothetical protein VIU81_07400 [Gaiellaceae bacterium]